MIRCQIDGSFSRISSLHHSARLNACRNFALATISALATLMEMADPSVLLHVFFSVILLNALMEYFILVGQWQV